MPLRDTTKSGSVFGKLLEMYGELPDATQNELAQTIQSLPYGKIGLAGMVAANPKNVEKIRELLAASIRAGEDHATMAAKYFAEKYPSISQKLISDFKFVPWQRVNPTFNPASEMRQRVQHGSYTIVPGNNIDITDWGNYAAVQHYVKALAHEFSHAWRGIRAARADILKNPEIREGTVNARTPEEMINVINKFSDAYDESLKRRYGPDRGEYLSLGTGETGGNTFENFLGKIIESEKGSPDELLRMIMLKRFGTPYLEEGAPSFK